MEGDTIELSHSCAALRASLYPNRDVCIELSLLFRGHFVLRIAMRFELALTDVLVCTSNVNRNLW